MMQEAQNKNILTYQSHFSLPTDPQGQSPLFGILAPELRDRILEYVLAKYEDLGTPYDDSTCYKRPGYFGPRRCTNAVLRTCQQLYNEAWMKPYTCSEHTFWLTSRWDDRCPKYVTSYTTMQQVLNLMHSVHGEVELGQVRVFGQLSELEPSQHLSNILDMAHFHPRYVTVTIRHVDCWQWTGDERLHIAAEWVQTCRFPASVREIRVEVESLERKKDQVDSVTSQMAEYWAFERVDGVRLVAQEAHPVKVMRWRGSSTWEGQRWVRDETRPGILEYYVATVTFRPDAAQPQDGDTDTAVEQKYPPSQRRRNNRYVAAPRATRMTWPERRPAFYWVDELESAGVTQAMSADEVAARMDSWRTG